MHTVNCIGDAIDYATCRANVLNLHHSGAINTQCAKLLLAATGENSLRMLPPAVKDRIRASIFKQMLISIEGKDD
jgi:transcriptional regulator CtsR